MSVFRINKKNDYTVMSNVHLKEKKMSLKAKGLLSVMLSLPDDWDYSIEGLIKLSKDNETSVKSALEELKRFKYLRVTKLYPGQTDSGRFEYIYDIFEKPQKQEGEILPLEILPLEILDVEILDVENLGLNKYTNNKILNNKILNNKNTKKEEQVYFENKKVNDIFLEFLDLRKKIKAINSDRAIKTLVNKLNKYDDDIKYKMIEQSIVNSWKDVYEVRIKKEKESFNEMLDRMKEESE